jgi:predicted NBD/HSP70 family sugar kinase
MISQRRTAPGTKNKRARTPAPAPKPSREIVIKRGIMARQEAEIIRLTRRRGGMSRVQIAQAMHMSPSAIAPYVGRLLAEGYLEEGENVVNGRGRPRIPLVPRAEAGCFLGVEIGLRFVRILRVDFAQQVEFQTRYEVGGGATKKKILGIFLNGLKDAAAGCRSRLLGCGIGVNGAVDPSRGISLCWKEVKGWENVPLAAMAREELGVPAMLESNNHCLALSELWYGAGHDHPTFLCIAARMTVGATIVIDRKPWNGSGGNSGLIGSWEVPSEILPEEARLEGERPFSERYGIPILGIASSFGFLSRIRRAIETGRPSSLDPANPFLFDFRPIHEAHVNGDPVVTAQLKATARALGWLSGNLAKLFDVPVIVVSGLRLMGSLVVEDIRRTALESLDPRLHKRPKILVSDLFEFASAMGAVSLLIQKWGPRQPMGPAQCSLHPQPQGQGRA